MSNSLTYDTLRKVYSRGLISPKVFRKALMSTRFNKDFSIQNMTAPSPDDQNFVFPTSSTTMWATDDIKFWPANKVIDVLEPGVYKPGFDNNKGVHLEKIKVVTDKLVVLPDAPMKMVLDEIDAFRRLKDEFTKRSILYKRGILLHGSQGCGKSSLIALLQKRFIDEGHVVILVDEPGFLVDSIRMIRQREPERMILCIIEDIDSMIDHHGESEILQVLDGSDQVNNIVTVATTNYPENLKDRIVNRPGRFDLKIEIDMPNSDSRRLYIKSVEPSLAENKIEEIVKGTDKMSIAHVREVVILHLVFGLSIDNAIKRVVHQSSEKLSSERHGNRSGPGFLTIR